MRTGGRRRWVWWLGAVLLVPLVGGIGLLAFPRVLCRHQVRTESIRLFYDDMPAADAHELARAVDSRLRAGGFAGAKEAKRVFVFHRSSAYAGIARLSGVPPRAQGFNLSVLGNTFVNAPRVAALGELSGRGPRYSVWEGDLAHTIAHEVGHQIVVDRIGRRALPQWKREGLAEYVANIGLIRQDGAADLVSRLAVFDDDRVWLSARGSAGSGWDRVHYEAGLLVEYLIEVREHSFAQVAADGVTLERTRSALRSWAAAR